MFLSIKDNMEKYLPKKTEKIVSALYMVTNTIKDDDSIKWRIREESISFLSSAFVFNTTVPFEKDDAIQSFLMISNSLISLLQISSVSGLISPMNTSLIISEIKTLVELLESEIKKDSHLPGYILSDSFFSTDNLSIKGQEDTKGQYKGQNIQSKTENKLKNKALIIKDKKNIRQESIINLLKKDSNLTIKDFVSVIPDCSEKTIQRELIFLVEKGVIRKDGERRWSKYSLK